MNRTIAVANELSRAITSKHDAAFLIIDEGPGLSGSSFGSVADSSHERVFRMI
jgi:hypothetical protein